MCTDFSLYLMFDGCLCLYIQCQFKKNRGLAAGVMNIADNCAILIDTCSVVGNTAGMCMYTVSIEQHSKQCGT
jgi:hypothetical protein